MRVETILEDERVFEAGRPVTFVKGTDRRQGEIEFSQVQHGRRIIKLRGVDSISEAERLVGGDLVVPEHQIPAVEEGLYYTFHLKGCDVVTVSGEKIGTVTDVLDSGGTELLQVEGTDGELLIPFAQSYLRQVDIKGRRIEVDLPEGLRDLNK
jgi:16S rRNA processing protein RimM